MKVLVFGGTGAMGIHLVELLSKRGIEVYVTSRTKRDTSGNISYVQGNAQDIDFLETLLQERWDAIVDFMVYSTDCFKDRIELLLNASSHYFFLSSARVYADSEVPITETTSRLLDKSVDKEYLSTDEYSLAKARQEDILQNSKFTNWTIIRPYITYSQNRLQLGVLEKEEWLFRALHGRTIVFSKDICSRKTTLTYGLDVSKGISELVGNSRALGEIFQIASEESCSWEAVLKLYLEILESHLGLKPKVLLQDLDSFIEWKSGNYQIFYDRLFNRSFDCSKIAQFVDVRDFTKIDDGLRSCLVRFLERPIFRTINWKMEALKDKKVKEFTPIKEIPGFRQKARYLIYRYLIK